MSRKKNKTVPPHFSPSSAGFAAGVGNIMQFTLSLSELSPITSPSALLCMGIAHTAALGVGFAGELMLRTVGRPGSTSMVCLWFMIPVAVEKTHYTQLKHFYTFSRASSKVSPVMAVHAALQAPLSSWRWSWAGLSWCQQAWAVQHSCLLPRDSEGQRWAPVAARHTCTGQFGSGPLCDGYKSIYELQAKTSEAHHSPSVASVAKMMCSWQYCQETLFLRLNACKEKLPL